MKLAVLFLAAFAAAAPSAINDDKLVVTNECYPEALAIYTGNNDIVDIVVPLNNINFGDDGKIQDIQYTLFFVEADVKDGVKEYKGLYVRKGDKVKKVLDNGQCSTYASGYLAYFGAKDGIYKYNHVDQTATKFGNVTDSVIKMAYNYDRSEVYFLTEDYVLYKYNEDDVKTSKVEAVKDARDIAFDFSGFMFYYDGTKQFYVCARRYNGYSVSKIEGLPANATNVQLVRVPTMIDQAFAVIDGVLYSLQNDGTIEKTGIEFQTLPTAYAPDVAVVEWFAFERKIYEYDLLKLIADKSINKLNDFFFGKDELIRTLKNLVAFNPTMHLLPLD